MQHEGYYVGHIQYMDYVQIDLHIVVAVDKNSDHNLNVHDVDDAGYSYSYYYMDDNYYMH